MRIDPRDDAALDRALEAWARRPAGDRAAEARIMDMAERIARRPAPSLGWGWIAGVTGAAAAAAALALMVSGVPPAAGPSSGGHDVEWAGTDPQMDSFALLHVLTDEEEYLL